MYYFRRCYPIHEAWLSLADAESDCGPVIRTWNEDGIPCYQMSDGRQLYFRHAPDGAPEDWTPEWADRQR